MRYLLITDIPAPWREKVFERVYEKLGKEFHVVYCKNNEKRRLWKFPLGEHSKTFLKAITLVGNAGDTERERFLNLGIIPFMLKTRPKIVIGFSLNPTVLIGFLLAKALKSKTIVFADTWLGRDKYISEVQRVTRRLIYRKFGDAFIGASRQTLNMYWHYYKEAREESLFLSPLCADNDYFREYLEGKEIEERYDIMFAGRIVDTKNPSFFTDVALRIKEKLGYCKVLIIGEGNEKVKKKMFEMFRNKGIEYHYGGFIEHQKLPEYYSQAKILLMPTSGDCWGVVINEAMICGVPVITTNMTAASGELVIDGENGYVLPLDSSLWAEKICSLLKDDEKYETFSKRAKEMVSQFNFEQAAQGIIGAIEYLDN